jgi:hypothetical protein
MFNRMSKNQKLAVAGFAVGVATVIAIAAGMQL